MPKPEQRPNWAWNHYQRWHAKACDHSKPDSCGFEGSMWFRTGDGWSRRNAAGKVITVFEDGRVQGPA